jgi:hypothetical protein
LVKPAEKESGFRVGKMLDVPNYDKFATLEQMGRDRCKIKIGY